ncbi:MAG: hypothetical protein RQ982_05775 [Gammaproteobacteria bacterium]|nr:hypothetical protein [Gammaproteobacteria bacterium]
MVKRNAYLDRNAMVNGGAVLNFIFMDEWYSTRSQEGDVHMSGINYVC